MSYLKFGAMIATSTAVMFALMYLNAYSLDHVQWSETRFYMALIMGAAMAIVMMSFMFGTYGNRLVNVAVLVAGVAVFAGSLHLVRSQDTVDDVDWMKAMIPHHSTAILTSERADLKDAHVRRLADQIIETQRREIEQMQELISELESGGRIVER
jgi:hypothetical protein